MFALRGLNPIEFPIEDGEIFIGRFDKEHEILILKPEKDIKL